MNPATPHLGASVDKSLQRWCPLYPIFISVHLWLRAFNAAIRDAPSVSICVHQWFRAFNAAIRDTLSVFICVHLWLSLSTTVSATRPSGKGPLAGICVHLCNLRLKRFNAAIRDTPSVYICVICG